VVEHENKTVDTVEQDTLSRADESNQSNTEPEQSFVLFTSSGEKICLRSTSTILGQEDPLSQEEDPQSDSSIDFKISKKYPLTLEQARKRALRAIKRARERDSLLADEDDES